MKDHRDYRQLANMLREKYSEYIAMTDIPHEAYMAAQAIDELMDYIDSIKTPPAQPAPVQQKPLFADIIAKHPGLAEELKAMDAAPVQEWMKPNPKCDEACLFQCTKGFTQFPECAATPPIVSTPLAQSASQHSFSEPKLREKNGY